MDVQDQDKFLGEPLHQPVEQSVIVLPDETNCIEVARKVAERNQFKEDWDESFFVCDVGWILDQYKRWKRELPGVDVYYAVKANSLQPVISTLAALGCGFDCEGKDEISAVSSCGVTEDRIQLSRLCNFTSHIQFANERKIPTVTFSNEAELRKLKDFYPAARLVVRIRAEEEQENGDHMFEASCEHAMFLIRKAMDLKMNIIGISFRVGCNPPSIQVVARAIKNSRRIFDFASELGYKFNLLDIGGNYFRSIENESIVSFENMASVIRESLDTHFPSDLGVKVVATPGDFFCGDAYLLATNITGKKVTTDRICYHVGEGIYGSFLDVYIGKAKFHPILLQPSKEISHPTTVYGVSADGCDVIAESVMLPEVEMSDWLVWKGMGSNVCLEQYGFNGFSTYKACHFISSRKLSELQKLCEYPKLMPKTRNII